MSPTPVHRLVSALAAVLLASLAPACFDSAPPPKKTVTTPPKAPPKAPPRDTGSPSETNRAPTVDRISWEPRVPTTLDHLRLDVKVSDPDPDDFLTTRYQWFRNGEKVFQLVRDNVPAAELKKGDVLEVEVTVQDRAGASNTLRSPEITVGNAVPVFNMDPRAVRKIDGLRVVAEDPDEEALTFSLQGAPKGMRIDPRTGVLRYEGSKDEKGGHYTIEVRAADPDKAHASWRFEIDVSPGSGAAEPAGTSGRAAKAEGDRSGAAGRGRRR